MALPFLPTDSISRAFSKLKCKASTAKLKVFAAYLENTWIHTNIWPPSCWSVFLQAIRTNAIKGWHNSLNRRAQGKIDSATTVCAYPVSPRQNPPDKPPNQNGLGKKVVQDPEALFQADTVKNIQPLGPVREWGSDGKAAVSLLRTRTKRQLSF